MAELPGIAPQFSDKQLAQRAAILRACRTLMADEGRSGMTLAYVARLIWIPAAAIRQHFINLDSVLFEILLSHLQAISKAMANIPPDAPDIYAARRKAYLAYTRTPWGALTEDHVLLTRDVFTLRPQDHQVLWDLHRGLGQLLGGDRPESTLQLLDFPGLDRQEIEEILAKRTASHAARREAHQAAAASREAAGQARQAEPEAPVTQTTLTDTTNAHTAAAQPTQAAPKSSRPKPGPSPQPSPTHHRTPNPPRTPPRRTRRRKPRRHTGRASSGRRSKKTRTGRSSASPRASANPTRPGPPCCSRPGRQARCRPRRSPTPIPASSNASCEARRRQAADPGSRQAKRRGGTNPAAPARPPPPQAAHQAADTAQTSLALQPTHTPTIRRRLFVRPGLNGHARPQHACPAHPLRKAGTPSR